MPGKQHSLNSGAFAALLGALDPDLLQAARRYERLREKLIRLFTWRGCHDAAELADETINRVALRVLDDSAVGSRVEQFSVGVAHRIYLEVLRSRARDRSVDAALRHQPASLAEREATDPELLKLEHCISELPADDRQLVLEYYRDAGDGLKETRKRLAEKLAVSPGNLRIRVHRVRARLEKHMAELAAATATVCDD
ncbi:MAG: hypothetical protein AAGA23_07020 [Pseudomonadota bacterium]